MPTLHIEIENSPLQFIQKYEKKSLEDCVKDVAKKFALMPNRDVYVYQVMHRGRGRYEVFPIGTIIVMKQGKFWHPESPKYSKIKIE